MATTSGAGGRNLFGLTIGLLVGVLVTLVVVPRDDNGPHVTTQANSAPATIGDSGAGPVPGEIAAGAPTDGGPSVSAPAGSAGGEVRGQTPGSPAPTPAPAGSSGPVRGVTATSVKVGIAVIDTTGLSSAGPGFNPGNIQQQWEAVIDGMNRDHRLPVNGRTIELAFKKYNFADDSDQRSACVNLVQDQKAFVVVGVQQFPVGAECVAREFRTPLITALAPNDDVFQRSAPFLFSIDWSSSRSLRNLASWAHQRGLLNGKKIGIYSVNDATRSDIQKHLRGSLTKLGYHIAAEVQTEPNNASTDTVAIQRFRQAGVDVVFLFAGTSNWTFLRQADAQGYRPKYLTTDFVGQTNDAVASLNAPNEWDGTQAVTAYRRGEAQAGIPFDAAQEACVRNYERYSGKRVDRGGRDKPEVLEVVYVLTACDEANLLLRALQGAGSTLTPTTFVRGMESLRSIPMLTVSPVSFTATKHDGTDLQRTLQWNKGCVCWKALGQFEPAPAP